MARHMGPQVAPTAAAYKVAAGPVPVWMGVVGMAAAAAVAVVTVAAVEEAALLEVKMGEEVARVARRPERRVALTGTAATVAAAREAVALVVAGRAAEAEAEVGWGAVEVVGAA